LPKPSLLRHTASKGIGEAMGRVGHITLVERQYAAASELSEALGSALTDIKRVQLGLPGAGDVSRIQIDAGRQAVDEILLALVRTLDGENHVDGVPIELSASLVDWISTLRRGHAITLGGLRTIRYRLAQSPTILSTADFKFLDQLLLIIEAHANHLMHRLPVGGRM
jgi:hypothetical protein